MSYNTRTIVTTNKLRRAKKIFIYLLRNYLHCILTFCNGLATEDSSILKLKHNC